VNVALKSIGFLNNSKLMTCISRTGISADGMNRSKYGCQNKLLSLNSEGGTEAEEKENVENKRRGGGGSR
jgi:hypothetical protein